MAYKDNPPPAKSRMGPLFTGVAVGVLLGVLLALGFALWLNRNATPFVEKAKAVEALPARPADAPKFDATQPGGVAPSTKAAASGTAATIAGEKPRFEFYQILPDDKNSKGKAPATAAKPETKAGPAKDPPAGKESYMLQAGAFQSESDAESLKAKIAFAGMEASVRQVNLPDKGTLYRVRLGPYRSLDEVNRIKTALSQNGIAAAVVKPE
jgi:cell division protein FtsN